MKIFTLLRKIKGSELSIFQKYLQFVYEKSDSALPLFDYLRKFHPDFEMARNMEPKTLHAKLFADKPYYEKRIANLCSDLYLDLKNFLLFREIRNNPFEIKYLWLTILKKRNLGNEFYKAAKQLHEDTQAKKQKSTLDYLQGVVANRTYFYESDPTDTVVGAKEYQDYADNLDICYALLRLKTACEMASLNRIKGGQYALDNIPHVLALIPQDKITAHPLLHLYLELYNLVQHPSDETYNQAASLFRQYATDIDAEELIKALSYLTNYCAARVRSGAAVFWEIALQVIQFTFAHTTFSRVGALSSIQFNNIFQIACNAKEYAWAKEFIKQQSPYLEIDQQADTQLMAEVTLLFEQRKYTETLEILSKNKFRDVYHTIRANVITLVSCFEIRPETVDIPQICDNFDTYLYRLKKKKANNVQFFINFNRIFRLLLRSEDSLEVIQQEINKAGTLAQRAWLLEKLDGYKPRYAAQGITKV